MEISVTFCVESLNFVQATPVDQFFFLVYGYITKSRDALYMMYPEAGHSVCLGK